MKWQKSKAMKVNLFNNRQDIADQLKHILKEQKNLYPEDAAALVLVIEELESNCGNCAHRSANFCTLYSFHMPDKNHYCKTHEIRTNE